MYRQPTIQFAADRWGVVHAPVGYVSLSAVQLLANFKAFLRSLINAASSPLLSPLQHHAGQRAAPINKLIQCIHICTTMGPSIKVDLRAC